MGPLRARAASEEANPKMETTCGELALSRNFEETDPEGAVRRPSKATAPPGSTALEDVAGGSAEALGSKRVLNPLVMDAGVVIEGRRDHCGVPRVMPNPRAASVRPGHGSYPTHGTPIGPADSGHRTTTPESIA